MMQVEKISRCFWELLLERKVRLRYDASKKISRCFWELLLERKVRLRYDASYNGPTEKNRSHQHDFKRKWHTLIHNKIILRNGKSKYSSKF